MMKARRGGYLLLEVVLSLTLLLMGLTYIGGQVQKTDEAARESVDLTRILMLTESKLAELDTGLVPFEDAADNEIEGDFSLRFPDYGWQIRVDETATEKLRAIRLDILYAVRDNLESEFVFRDAEIVHTVYTMRAEPTTVDLKADFGITEDALKQLSETIPIEGFDPSAFDVSMFQSLDPEDLLAILPSLLQMFGLTSDEARNLLPPEFRDLLDQAEASGEMPDSGSGSSGQNGAGGRSPAGGQPAGGQPSGGLGTESDNLSPEEREMLRELEQDLGPAVGGGNTGGGRNSGGRRGDNRPGRGGRGRP